MPSVSELADTYRKADQRLRMLLFGDGSETPGRVRGEESRQQVNAELRRMRTAFLDASLASEKSPAEDVQPRDRHLDEALQQIASLGARSQRDAIPELVTPAEAAQALSLSVGSIYRGVRDGEIRAVRLTDKRGALRIPVSELARLLEAASSERDPVHAITVV